MNGDFLEVAQKMTSKHAEDEKSESVTELLYRQAEVCRRGGCSMLGFVRALTQNGPVCGSDSSERSWRDDL